MNRRRQYLLIASAAVMALLGGYWLTRPQVDPRFVGTWSMRISGIDVASYLIRFDPDGTGASLGSGQNPPVSFQWWVRDNQLFLSFYSANAVEAAFQFTESTYRQVKGSPGAQFIQSYAIVDATWEEIRAHGPLEAAERSQHVITFLRSLSSAT